MAASGIYTASTVQLVVCMWYRLHNQSRSLTLKDGGSYLVGWLSLCDPDLGTAR